jgi:hypothetical protein
MVGDRTSGRSVGRFGLQRKSLILDRRSPIERISMVHNAYDLRSTVQITLRQNCSTISKKKKSLEPFSYFGHNWSILSRIEMKLMVLSAERIYTRVIREGHCPILLGFVRKCKIVVFKDLGPNHWQRSRLS